MKKIILIAVVLSLSACGYKFDNDTYACKGTEKVFYPIRDRLSYVAPDAAQGYSEKKEVFFKLKVEHKNLPILGEVFRVGGKYGYYSKDSKDTDVLYDNLSGMGGFNSTPDDQIYTGFDFDQSIGKFEEVKGFYRHGKAKNSTRLTADVFTTVQAECKLVK